MNKTKKLPGFSSGCGVRTAKLNIKQGGKDEKT
jgi:hypothetical protein